MCMLFIHVCIYTCIICFWMKETCTGSRDNSNHEQIASCAGCFKTTQPPTTVPSVLTIRLWPIRQSGLALVIWYHTTGTTATPGHEGFSTGLFTPDISLSSTKAPKPTTLLERKHRYQTPINYRLQIFYTIHTNFNCDNIQYTGWLITPYKVHYLAVRWLLNSHFNSKALVSVCSRGCWATIIFI